LDELQDWREEDSILQSCLQDAFDYIGLAITDLAVAKEWIESEKAK